MSDFGNQADSNKNDPSVSNVCQSARPRTLSEKGLSYECEKTLSTSRDLARKIRKLCEKISKLSSSEDYERISEAVMNLNEVHDEYERVLAKADQLGSAVPQSEAQEVILAVTTAKLDAMKVTLPSNTEKSISSGGHSDKEQSCNAVENEGSFFDVAAANVIISENSSTKMQDNKQFKESPEQLVKRLDEQLQKQLYLVDQSVLSNNKDTVQLELDNLASLMIDISERKSQLSSTLNGDENDLLNSWYDQANVDVSRKRSLIKDFLSSTSGIITHAPSSEDVDKHDSSKTTQSSTSVISVIKRDTSTINHNENVNPCSNNSVKNKRSSSQNSSKISERSQNTTQSKEKSVSKWLLNHDDRRSLCSSNHSSNKKLTSNKSSGSGSICSENLKFAEKAKCSMLRIHKNSSCN